MKISVKSEEPQRLPHWADSGFLLAIVLLSTLPYVSGLGFYSDDWAFRSAAVRLSNEGWFRMFVDALRANPDLRVRPVQAAYLELTFKCFGDGFLGYHLLSAVVLGLVAILVYAILQELRAQPGLALAIAAVYGLLPQYSTDRFWQASAQAALSMLFALLGIYGLLRSLRSGEPGKKIFGVGAAVALVLSFLSYEVPAGLIVASLGTIGWGKYKESRAAGRRGIATLTGLGSVAILLLAVGVIKSAFQRRIVYNHNLLRFLGHLGNMGGHAVSQAIQFNLWSYLLRGPWAVIRLHGEGALSNAAIATAALLSVVIAAYLGWRMDGSSLPGRRVSFRLIAAGFVLYFLGVALFFRDLDSNFSAPGLNNRVMIAAALGAALIAVAITGLVCSLLTSEPARRWAFSVAIGLVCGVNSLIVSGIAHYWVEAANDQAAILSSVRSNVPPLPPKSVLMLDGFCRYDGPGIVFETDWDTTGALQLLFNDYSLTGDVVSLNSAFGEAGIGTTMYGDAEGHYLYGEHLYVYNVRQRSLRNLQSKIAAQEYLLAMNPGRDNGCPVARDGDGAKIF